MSKQTQMALVPELRFPEFRDAGEWEDKPLNEVAEYENGKAHEKGISEEGAFIVVNSKFISTDGQVKKYTDTAFCIAEKDDILMVLSDLPNGKALAKCFFVDTDNVYTVNQRICKLTPNKVVSIMLFYSLNRKPYFLAFDDGVKQTNLKKDDVLNCSILLRKDTEEQQKIADCLSSIDELITAHTQKHDALKAHKKGLMQQLFPAVGETVPKLRFPEFRDAGEWEEIKFFDTADKKIKWSFIGGPFGSNLKSSDYVEEGVRIIQLQNIGDAEFKGKYKIFTSEEKANELLSNNIYPGDIILSKMGDPVGRACLIPDIHTRYVMCSDGIRLVVDEMKHSKYFIYSLINSIPFRSLIEKTATGSTRKRIGLSELKSLPMLVPELKGEQQKIADCLSSIDELITAHTQKHDALKAHKKGLMQQLFPTTGEAGA